MSKSRSRWLAAAAVAASIAAASPAGAQISEDGRLVTSPTAAVLPHGGYLFEGRLGPESSILVALKVGFFDRFMVGISYGFQEFIGRGDVTANDLPGFDARLRVIEETERGPAFALGLDTQGQDAFLESADRYERKSKGAFAVISKNYHLIGDFSLHGGVNYSFEDRDEAGVNAFAGLELDIIKGFGVLLDYDAALDDNDESVATHMTRGKGYLDLGLRFDYGANLRFKFLLQDLLDNYLTEHGVERAIEVFYLGAF
jgi:hypothetical protein